MGRLVNPKIKEEILEKILVAISHKGLNNLSLRGIGREIGVSDRMLVFHFQTYDNLINSAFVHLSIKHKKILNKIILNSKKNNLASISRQFLKIILTDEYRNNLLVFLEFYVKALRSVDSYKDFFDEVLIKWIDETEVVIKSI